MNSQIDLNKELIQKVSNSFKFQKIDAITAINVLSNNQSALKYFIESLAIKHEKNELILRIYGLFQVLFVSIDALYTLSYSIFNSKNFLSINDNKNLRDLKYIRNDVIGHPTNRVVDEHIEYSILKSEDIYEDHIIYTTYYNNDKTSKEIDLVALVDTYFKESNSFLEALINYNTASTSIGITDDIYNMYNIFEEDKDISVNLKAIKKAYLKNYESGRILKKINLLLKLLKEYKTYKSEELFFVIEYHLASLYEYSAKLEGVDILKLNKKAIPSSVIYLKRYINKKNYLKNKARNIYDINHPLFNLSLNTLENEFRNNIYIKNLVKYYKAKNKEFVYAFASALSNSLK